MKQVQHIRDKFLVKKTAISTSKILVSSVLLSAVLSGCVTQQFENGETPVVQNQANRDDMAATRISLGLGYLKMGNMPQAKQNLEKAKNFAPDMVQVYTAFAHYYETVGEQNQTVEAYEKALSIKSDDADTLNNYGVYLCRQKQVEAAEQQFLKAIAVPSYILVAKSYENLSSCFLQKDDFAKAEMYLNKAIRHSPSSASTLFQMVRLQYAMADYKQAKGFEQRFEKVTRRFTSQSLALAYKVYMKLGEKRTARNYGTMLVKMYPQSWEAQQYLLNELELIDADNLAKRYQLTQVSDTAKQSKKRIVKLSPRKYKPTNVEPKVAAQKEAITVEQVSNEVSAPVTKIIKTPTASSAAINAALMTTVVEPKSTAEVMNSEADKEVITKTVNENTPLEDTEIFHVAKKPAAIVEDTIEEVVETNVAAKVVTTEKAKPAQEELKPEKKKQPPKSAEVTKRFPDFHVVEVGDTLYNISVKYNIKIKALRRWNKIAKNKRLYIKDIIFLENPKSVNK